MNSKFYGFAFGAMALSLLASCSNEVKNEPNTPDGALPQMQLAKTPDLVIWSANEVLAGQAPANVSTKATNKYDNKEVEVNLAIQDVHTNYDIEDLVTHLSIHVRTATDVTVVLPIEKKYYCDQDDLYIYNERGVDDWSIDETETSLTATVVGSYKEKDEEGEEVEVQVEQDVTLTIVFNDDNITISTKDITDKVIKACKAANGDGINFDVYNYYIRGNQYTTGSYAEWSLQGLSEALSSEETPATIEFGEGISNVDFYINAFTGNKVNGKNNVEVDADYPVVPVESEIEKFIKQEDKNSDNIIYINRDYPGLGGWDGENEEKPKPPVNVY